MIAGCRARRRARTIFLALIVVLAISVTASSAAAPTKVAGKWGFGVKQEQVRDLSGNGRPLQLVGDWTNARGRSGSAAVQFGWTSLAIGGASSELDPGRRTFAVAIVFRAPRGNRIFNGTDTPNLVQKGRYGSSGQWKLQLKDGKGGQVQCRMKGSAAAAIVTSRVRRVAADGHWHKAICARHDRRIELIVDGRRIVKKVRVGKVASSARLSIANKSRQSTQDQFRGRVDALAIAHGRSAVEKVRIATQR